MISPQRRREIIDALRRGTVPQRGLDAFAVGTDRFAAAFDDELATVAAGGAGFKAVRGEYGSGKTFVVRWLAERARTQGFATAEVQISERETPLHHLEAVYRRLCERLTTADTSGGALRAVVDSWFFALHEDVMAAGTLPASDAGAVLAATDALAEQRLGAVAARAPALAAVLRGYRRALADGDNARAEGLLAWLGGQPHVAAPIKRAAGIRGDLDHDAALAFLAGLLTILRGAGYAGLVFVLDEVETLQRIRSDARDRALNALRQLIDEVDLGRFPGLYLVITGTPAFFDGPQGAQRLAPLAQRLHTDFTTNARFDSPRAVQLRLAGFTVEGLGEVGRRIRDLYAEGATDPNRIRSRCDDDYLALLAKAVTGDLGGRVGVAPRVFLKKLVGDILDRIDQFPDFNPRRDYRLTIVDSELTAVERNARAASSVDEIDLDL
ncbi:MAG TPA: BREX system ATP-binding protein BrxD [Actinomycetes bacterium]|nr:BREX system ATP-binding protein BrxD [Actinomycetes bacterium]